MPSNAKDKFPNLAVINVVESAANTLTFKKLETGISFQEKLAWIIHRVELYAGFDRNAVYNSVNDFGTVGLSVSNTITSMQSATAFADPSTILWHQERIAALAAGASAWLVIDPSVRDFANLPGGGLIVPPTPLYGWCQGSGCASAMTWTLKLYYTVLEMATDDYWQLIEARRVLSA